MTDPIADMLTRVRNSQAVNKETVSLPFSEFKFNLAKIILKNGYLADVKKNTEENKSEIILTLGYDNNKPLISHIKRLSRPGRRIYTSKDKIRPVLRNYGISIISTSAGLMTNKEARKNNLGGELICEIW